MPRTLRGEPIASLNLRRDSGAFSLACPNEPDSCTIPAPMLKHDAIRDRLTDAKVLWQNDRKNGAFIQVLIALAGLASIRYPKKTDPKVYFDKMREYHPNQASQIAANEKKQKRNRLSDEQQFKCLVLDLIEDIILPHPTPGVVAPKYNITLPLSKDKMTNIEDLFYKALRCTAVHQGTFSSVAYLTERINKPDQGIHSDALHLTEPAGIPEGWILNMLEAMGKVPELA